VCNFANANETCPAGVCGIGSCSSGFANCDGVTTNGCEANLGSTSNSLSCGNVCTFPNGFAACTGAGCLLSVCDVDFGNCDGNAANGCESNLGTDDLNCGSCGYDGNYVPPGGLIPVPRSCVGGTCR
jgi:hypothetical protein